MGDLVAANLLGQNGARYVGKILGGVDADLANIQTGTVRLKANFLDFVIASYRAAAHAWGHAAHQVQLNQRLAELNELGKQWALAGDGQAREVGF